MLMPIAIPIMKGSNYDGEAINIMHKLRLFYRAGRIEKKITRRKGRKYMKKMHKI